MVLHIFYFIYSLFVRCELKIFDNNQHRFNFMQHATYYHLSIRALCTCFIFCMKKKTPYKFVVKIQTDRNSMNSEILVIVMLFSLTPFHFYLIFNWQATSNRHTQMNTHFSICIDLFETKTQPYHPFNDKKVRNTVSIVYAVCIYNFYSTYKTKLTISCCFVPFIQRILTIFGRLYRFLFCIFNVNENRYECFKLNHLKSTN